MTQTMTNDQLIEQARNGNAQPLLDKLASGTVPTSAGTDYQNGDLDGSVSDTLWYDVLAAKLPEDVMGKCYDALGAK